VTDDPLVPVAGGRPVWLITLADLALLLVGFLVFLQASRADPTKLAQGFRAGFDAAPAPAPMPVEVAGMAGFAPGSATLPGSPAAAVAWARATVRDPRVALTVTGQVDGSAEDVDPLTGSGAVLAADRARALAAALAAAGAVPAGRLAIVTGRPGRRAATVTLGFAGPRP
jgi:hypothetical protein